MQKNHKQPALIIFILVFFISLPTHAQKAPAFSLKDSNNKTVNLSSFKGKLVYVDFWASWCGPCRKSFPFLNNMHKSYGQKGLKVIGINLDNDKADASKFLKKFPAEFTVVYDPDGKTPKQYGLSVMPTSYLIDRKGNIIGTHKGFKESHATDIEATIKQALANK